MSTPSVKPGGPQNLFVGDGYATLELHCAISRFPTVDSRVAFCVCLPGGVQLVQAGWGREPAMFFALGMVLQEAMERSGQLLSASKTIITVWSRNSGGSWRS